MPTFSAPALTSPLDSPTRALVRLAAEAAGGNEAAIRTAIADAARATPAQWVEELLLQTYLFAGFPRALNATREWRRTIGESTAPDGDADADYARAATWRARGEETCAVVYGGAYDALRHNIANLHPALDTWMIVEGYGKVLSRPQLDLTRRELCIVAACAHTGQDRQLHSHLRGALHAGASPDVVNATFDALDGVLSRESMRSARLLFTRVRARHE
jgi:4-carboxymuconolactone decarboxylase